MSYASLDDLKLAIRITDDTDDDTLLQVALDAASSAIDEHCDRTFVADEEVSVRYFTPDSNGRVEVDDFYTTEDLVIEVGGTAVPAAVPFTSNGYVLEPSNALAKGEPITAFRYTTATGLTWATLFAIRRASVRVTARWGYAAAVPESVRQACILQASRIFARRLSPYGVAGSPDLGNELRLLSKVDPDVAVLLSGKVRY